MVLGHSEHAFEIGYGKARSHLDRRSARSAQETGSQRSPSEARRDASCLTEKRFSREKPMVTLKKWIIP